MTSPLFTIQLDTSQKELFDNWLNDREVELEKKLQSIRSLRQTMNLGQSKSIEVPELKLSSQKSKSFSQSWTTKTLKALQTLGESQTSNQVIGWMIEKDAELKDKTRRYITKNVTSKLSLLVDKGLVVKEVSGGKNHYTLKNIGK